MTRRQRRAVATAAHDVFVPVPASAAGISTQRITIARGIPDGRRRRTASRSARRPPTCSSPSDRRRVPRSVTSTTPDPRSPASGGRGTPRPRHRPRAHAAVPHRPRSPVPTGPARADSKTWTEEYNEVKELGSSTSTTRTAEQTVAALFWAEAPVRRHAARSANSPRPRQLDIVDASRFMAMINVAYADALSPASTPSTIHVLAADHSDP